MIRFEQFAWRFAGSPSWALRDVSVTIGPGEFVVMAGPSGSGKSTLAMAMCGLLIGRHDGEAKGHVFVNGQDVSVLPLHRTAETIALVQQNPETQFATLTVGDEIAFGMENRCLDPAEIRSRSGGALAGLGISHIAERALATLSGGEKQRVAIASILATRPVAVVLDEPTASLDPETSRELFVRLASLSRETGLTVVVIEHKLEQLSDLRPRFVYVCDGRLASARQNVAPALPERPRPPVQSDPSADHLADLSHVRVCASGKDILKDVSLRIRAGEIVAVTGPNGGGKTTLLHTLTGLVGLSGGSVEICGIPVPSTTGATMAGQVGVVFQNADHQIVADTVWSEALFTPWNLRSSDRSIEQRADALLVAAGLADRKRAHPYRLSWGQKRRLNLISALLHRPRLLLLDEPFAGQDTESLAFLLEAIRGVIESPPRGACVIVTHDPRIITGWATRVVFVDGGRVVVDAPAGEAIIQLIALGHEAYVTRWTEAPSPSTDRVRAARVERGVLSPTTAA